MAIISAIRNRSGLVLGLILGALVIFLLSDLFANRMDLFQDDPNKVGTINGREISVEEFNAEYQKLRLMSDPTASGAAFESSLRRQAWTKLIEKYAYGEQYDQVGVELSAEEEVDMVMGQNIHPQWRQLITQFTGGQFDRDFVNNLLAGSAQLTPEQMGFLRAFMENIYDARLKDKYENLFYNTSFVPDAMAARRHVQQNSTASVKYVYVPFDAVADSLVEVTTGEMEAYIEANPRRFQEDRGKTAKYVVFKVIPSAADSLAAKEKAGKVAASFAASAEPAEFARVNTDPIEAQLPPFGMYKPNNLPADLTWDSLKVGSMYGPYFTGGRWKMYRPTDSVRTVASASHILLSFDRNLELTTEQLKKKADSLLALAQANPGGFAGLAMQNSDDGSAAQGGALGEFERKTMVAPFADAVFGMDAAGIYPEVVETQYGYHIINVTAPAVGTKGIATVEVPVQFSQATNAEVYRQADGFAKAVDTEEEFLAKAEELGLEVQEEPSIDADQALIGTLPDATRVVSWLYNQAELGDVSPRLSIGNDTYVVAVMTAEQEKGLATLESAYDRVYELVANEKKAAIITEKLSSIAATDIDEIAAEYGQGAQVFEMEALSLVNTSLQGVPAAPAAVGVAFGQGEGNTSKPVVADRGVVIIHTRSVSEAGEIADYTAPRRAVVSTLQASVDNNIRQAILDDSDIEDKRYKMR